VSVNLPTNYLTRLLIHICCEFLNLLLVGPFLDNSPDKLRRPISDAIWHNKFYRISNRSGVAELIWNVTPSFKIRQQIFHESGRKIYTVCSFLKLIMSLKCNFLLTRKAPLALFQLRILISVYTDTRLSQF